MRDLRKSHCIVVSYSGPTDTRGSRVKLSTFDLAHRNNNRAVVRFFPYEYEINGVLDQALKIVEKSGLKIQAFCETRNEYFIVTKWDFEKLSKLFKKEISP